MTGASRICSRGRRRSRVHLSPPYDARAVSNYVLALAAERGRPLTQMAILKIIFYAHGWYLATTGKPLFKQPVEAWEFGPVVKVVRDAFKSFGGGPITGRAEKLNLHTGEFEVVGADLSIDDKDFIKIIFDNYSKYTAFELSDMTHQRGSPWDKVWNTEQSVGRLGLRIKNEEIRQYFLSMHLKDVVH
jgi:uncharacterized phage-associated protein